MYDVVLVGAGVIGASIARELSKYMLDICLIEKENDVSCGASKANSGIVHGGYDAEPGSLKAKFNVLGNKLYEKLNKELNFGFRKCGSLVLGFGEEDNLKLKELLQRGLENNVDGLKLIDGEAVRAMEPHVSEDVTMALYCREAGVTSPYELTIALAENAVKNGVTLNLNEEVLNIQKTEVGFKVVTSKNIYFSKYVINAAGYYSDKVAAMVGANNFKIKPRKGQYVLLDKTQGALSNHVLFQVPTKQGKGILVTQTYHGNLLLGPNSEDAQDITDINTDIDMLKHIVEKARKSVPDFNIKRALTSFSGIRASSDKHDFIIEESKVKGFINVAGIESPGLSSAPAIAKEVSQIVLKMDTSIQKNPLFDPHRKPIIVQKDNTFKGTIDDENPEKNIICRCEKVTESEIIDALNRGISIESLDAIKRRTRAGMGFCQGNFCGPRVRKLVAEHLHIPEEKITKRGAGSSFLPDRVEIQKLKI